MSTTAAARAPGVFVLGMHRSGTSVMAGVLDRLGLDGGPRDSMFAADEFNTDGYWEQRPLVEMHDAMLKQLGGFASAPPEPRSDSFLRRSLPDAPTDIERLVSSLFQAPWFVKDPRHCLLLPLWTEALGSDDLAVVMLRSPGDVVRSLRQRNGYSTGLALGLWERYTLDLLAGLEGRPAVVIRYEQLVGAPRQTIESLADVLARHVGAIAEETIGVAADLVRGRPRSGPSSPEVSSETTRRLADVLDGIVGYHPRFTLQRPLPVQSSAVRRRLARRRMTLRMIGSVIGHDAMSRSLLDRRRVLTSRQMRTLSSP